jgi:methyl-accepting chemotaxis protein-1 (serine sensor receptor)
LVFLFLLVIILSAQIIATKMKLDNLNISLRLTLLGAFFLLVILLISLYDWRAMGATNARATETLARIEALARAADLARSAQVEFKIQVQEWKNILIRGSDPADFKKYGDGFDKSAARTLAELDALKALLVEQGVPTAKVDGAQAALRELNDRYRAALKTYDGANPESYKLLDHQVKGMDRAPTKVIDDIVADIQAYEKATVGAIRKDNEAAVEAEGRLAIATLVTVLLVAPARS